MIRIAQASYGETGAYYQKAGNQTGQELNIREWYNKPWGVLLRAKDTLIAEQMASLAEKAVANQHIGYDQIDRTTYWQELKKVCYDPSQITTDCECDCSSFIMANFAAAMKYDDGWQWVTTHNLKSALLSTGQFEALEDEVYLTTDTKLKRGDILCKSGSHTVIVLDTAKDEQKDKLTEIKTKLIVLQTELNNIIESI